MGIFAPEITTVSNPKMNPASAATIDHLKNFVLSIANRNKTIKLSCYHFQAFRNCNYVLQNCNKT